MITKQNLTKIGNRTKDQDTLQEVEQSLQDCIQSIESIQASIADIISNYRDVVDADRLIQTYNYNLASQKILLDNLHVLLWVKQKGIWIGDTVKVFKGREDVNYKVGKVKSVNNKMGCIVLIITSLEDNTVSEHKTRIDYDVFFEIEKVN